MRQGSDFTRFFHVNNYLNIYQKDTSFGLKCQHGLGPRACAYMDLFPFNPLGSS